jgi:hypothetical protein
MHSFENKTALQGKRLPCEVHTSLEPGLRANFNLCLQRVVDQMQEREQLTEKVADLTTFSSGSSSHISPVFMHP